MKIKIVHRMETRKRGRNGGRERGKETERNVSSRYYSGNACGNISSPFILNKVK